MTSFKVLLSIGIYEYFKNNKFDINERNNVFISFLSITIFIFTIYRSFWIYSNDDKFIYFVLPLLFLSLMIINIPISKIFAYFQVILITLIMPIKGFLFIPLSILLTPFSTTFTWFTLNILGFDVYMIGQKFL